MFHRVNANILDKRRNEIARKHPLWTGDVENAKQAIGAAHALLGPIFEGEPRADSIVLHIIPEKGGALTSTEYAEDWRIGRGASLGSNLLADGADHGLTPEEVDAAQKALAKRAVAAMPTIAEKLAEKTVDPVADFFGGKRPSETTRHTLPGGVGIDVTVQDDASDEFRRIVEKVAERQDSTVAKGMLSDLNDTKPRKLGLSDMIRMSDEIKSMHGAGTDIVMGRDAFEQLKKLMSDKPVHDLKQFQGLNIHVSDAPGAPPMQARRRARNDGLKLGRGTLYTAPLGPDGKPSAEFREVGKVSDMHIIIDEAPIVTRETLDKLSDYLRTHPCKWDFQSGGPIK